MIRIVIVCLAVICLILLWRRLYRRYGKRLIWPAVFAALIGILSLLVATGRVHWVGLVFATALAGLKILLRIAARIPLLANLIQLVLNRHKSRDQPGDRESASTTSAADGTMSRSQALAVLGLPENASREQIIEAHRQLIQKIHPDRSGSGHLAATVNRARDLLLDQQPL